VREGLANKSKLTDPSAWKEAFIVNRASLLLQVELNPVMEANHLSLVP